jgi:Mn2+/Fe2+ NRAMP family transporter
MDNLSLFAYAATALTVDVPWGQVAHDTLVPKLIWQKDYIVAIVAVLGTTITPYCFFWQSSQGAEDERVDPAARALLDAPEQAQAQIGRIRIDAFIGMGFSNLIGLFIIITSAATVNAHGITEIQTSAQAAAFGGRRAGSGRYHRIGGRACRALDGGSSDRPPRAGTSYATSSPGKTPISTTTVRCHHGWPSRSSIRMTPAFY